VGVKYSASSARLAAELDSVGPGTTLEVAGLDASGCWRLRILAWARSSRVAFNQSRFPGWSDLSSNDQCSSLWAHRTTAGVKFADVALPGARRNGNPDASSMRTTRASPRESGSSKGHLDRPRAVDPWPDRTARRSSVSGEDDWTPRYNIAPTQPVAVIRQNPMEPRRELSLLRWGLIPSWAKDPSVSGHMINARSETVATKPAFRDPLTNRRCLIPADGFYEWQRRGKAKQPYCFEVNDGGLFAFAGLWDRWREPSGQWLKSCSILTTTPNAVTSSVHDRMPVILDPDSYDLWLDPGMTNVEAVSEMLKPFDARLMRCYPVSTRINYVANDGLECSAHVELTETQAGLFS
jgi:putative SOS response-associated peptidase YedK